MSNRSRRQTRTRDLTTAPAPTPPERRVVEKQVCFLGIEDIGSLIYLDHDGRNENPPSRRAAYAIGGTLMGFRPGDPRVGGDNVPAHGNTGHRVLMIQQGTAGGVAHKAPLNHLVKILRP